MNAIIRRKTRKRRVIIMSLLLVAALIGLGSYQWYRQQLAPVSSEEQQRYVSIEPGMSSVAIAEMLGEEGVIRNPAAFRLHARLQNLSHRIQAGFYILSPDMTAAEVLRTLADGETSNLSVRIPGGSGLDDVVDVLVDLGFNRGEAEAALQEEYDYEILASKPSGASLEGYIYPDTYFIGPNTSVQELVEMTLINAQQHISEDIIAGWDDQGLSIHEGLTLASIVQKESPIQDMPEIAGVFRNRLDESMRLESDATVNYALGTSNLQASYADTETNHPYNTYRIEGLPPGPVGNPEQAAIEASARPTTHDWLFFLHTPEEETKFSRTYEEHTEKKRRYLD